MRGREPYETARARWESEGDVRAVPEEIRELLRADALGVSLEELRRMPWEDVEARLAWLRGQQIAAGSKAPAMGT